MEYTKIPGIGQEVSRLVYGTGNRYVTGDDPEAAFRVLDHAWEAGFRIFDTAYSYGRAEENFGSWMNARGLRDQLVIIDKGCNPGQKGSEDVFSGQTIRQQMERSLERMKTTYTDIYILHRDDPARPVDEIVETLHACREKGMVGQYGVSNWIFDRILEANAYAKAHGLEPFTVVSPNYCMADYVNDPWGGSVSLSGPEAADYRKWLEETQTPVFNYSSLGRGYLSGKFRTDADIPIEECLWEGPILEYDCPENRNRLARAERMASAKGATVAQVCLKWLLIQPMNLFPIVSPSSAEHMEEVVGAFQVEMSEEEAAQLTA